MNRQVKINFGLAFIAFATIVLVILLSGCQCEGESCYIVVTATPDVTATDTPPPPPVDSPTPTQELATWTPTPTPTAGPSIACVPGGIYPLAGYCPQNYEQTHLAPGTTQAYPRGMKLDVQLLTADGRVSEFTNIGAMGDRLRLELQGFAGDVLFEIHGVEMFANHCYTLNMPMATNFQAAPFSPTYENVWAFSRLYLDDGMWFDLESHSLVQGDEPNKTLTGEIEGMHWTFQPAENMTVVWASGYHSEWAVFGNNHIDFLAWYVQDQPNTNLCR